MTFHFGFFIVELRCCICVALGGFVNYNGSVVILINIAAVAVLVRICFKFWRRVHDEVVSLPRFSWWLFSGIIVPLIVWAFFNCGFFSWLPPLVVDIEVAPRGQFLKVFSRFLIFGLWIIVLSWSAFTFGWVLEKVFPSLDRRPFLLCSGSWTLGLLPALFFLIQYYGWRGGLIGAVLYLGIISRVALPLVTAPAKVKPQYGTALTRINMGRYDEAEMEIVDQLEKCEEDFEGWMMLAKLYATRDHDVAAAEKVVFDLCEQRNVSLAEVASAFNKVADWHLSIADDPESARRVLAELAKRLAKTEFATVAVERMERIPPTRELWLAYRRSMPPRFQRPGSMS